MDYSSRHSRDRSRDTAPRKSQWDSSPPRAGPSSSHRPYSPTGSARSDDRRRWPSSDAPRSSSSAMPPPPSPLPPPPTASTSMPPPASPARREPLPAPRPLSPQPPPPSAPDMQSLTGPDTASPSSTASADRWNKRLELISVWMKQFAECEKIEQSIQLVSQSLDIQQNPVYRAKAEKNLEELKTKLADQSTSLRNMSRSIADSTDWPAGPQPGAEVVRTKYDTMISTLDDLSKRIASLDKMVATARQEHGEEYGMSVDSEESFSGKWRTLKHAPPQAEGTAKIPSSELAKIQRAFEDLEAHLDNMRNDMAQHAATMEEESLAWLVARHDEIQDARAKGTDPDARWRAKTTSNVKKLEGNLKELSKELVSMIEDSDKLEKRTEAVHAEHVQLHTDFEQMMARLTTIETDKRADEKEILALEAALEAYKNSTLTSSAPLTPAVIEPYLQTTVIPEMRKALQQGLGEVHKEIQSAMTRREGEIYATLWDKLRLTMSMVDTVSARLDKEGSKSAKTTAKPPVRSSSSSAMPPPAVPAHLQSSSSQR